MPLDKVNAVMPPSPRRPTVEWPTLLVAGLCYGGFVCGVVGFSYMGLVPALVVLTLSITLYSSLQHEVLHGHPFANQRHSDLLAHAPLGVFVPYERFRDQHLAHHYDPNLTDPYDDPESNFLDPNTWANLPVWLRKVLAFNNVLIGRMILGPVIGLAGFYAADLRAALHGDKAVMRAYIIHALGVAVVLAFVALHMPLAYFILASYLATSVLKIRTFLEHRAHDKASGRTVIIEDRGLLAFLFLNNNFHAVHHAHPKQPWYRLRQTYADHRDMFLDRNRGYFFASYAEVFVRYFLSAKDPVPHPLRPSGSEHKS